MSVRFEKTFAGIRIASGEVTISRIANALTLGYAERKVGRELARKGFRVVKVATTKWP